MKLTKSQRTALHAKFGGKCAYCGCELLKVWHADHIEAVKREFEFVKKGGIHVSQCTGVIENPHLDNLENLNPTCPQCNLYKHSMPLESFRRELSKQVERARKSSKNFQFAEKYGQVIVSESPIVFYFERFING
ncbi:MAG: HNH endonuclease [Sphingobacteriaceae bacterium]|nr:HNH endonuclease [Sphingobacteriaceae bacterium]